MNIDKKGMFKEKESVEKLIEYLVSSSKRYKYLELSRQDARLCLRALKSYRKQQDQTIKEYETLNKKL